MSDGSLCPLVTDADAPTYGGVKDESIPSAWRGGGMAKAGAALVYFMAIGEGYDFGVFGIVLARLKEDIPMSSGVTGLVMACLYSGMIVGASASGPGADWLGRKKAVCVACCFLAAGTCIQAFTTGISMLIAGRLVMGIGMGSGLPLGSTYIVETSPKELRGTLGTGFGACFSIGHAMGSVAGMMLQDTWKDWRVMLMLGSFAPLVVLLGMLTPWIPESPRWLVLQGDVEAARLALQQLDGGSSSVEEVLQDIVESPRRGKVGSDMAESWMALLRPSPEHRPRIMLSVGTLCSMFVSGFLPLTIYMPVLLADDLGRRLAVEVIGMISCTNALLSFGFASVAAEYIGRRPCLLGGYAILAAMYVQLGYFVSPWGLAQGGNRGWYFAAFWFFGSLAFTAGICPVSNFYAAEVLPMDLRATGMGFGNAVARCVAFVVTGLLPVMYEQLGWLMFMGLACSSALVFVFLHSAARETHGVPLEQIDKLFLHDSGDQETCEAKAGCA